MRRSLFILFFLSSLALLRPGHVSFGMHESLGIFGLIAINSEINIEKWDKKKNHLYLVGGVMGIPIIGGSGITWKRYFNSSRLSPFSTLSILGIYLLPICQTCGDNCKVKTDLLVSSSLGLDLNIIKLKKSNLNIQFGVLSMYSIGNKETFDSPSDKPSIWPIINFKFGS